MDDTLQVDAGLLQQISASTLTALLDKIVGPKTLVLTPSLAGPLGLITEVGALKVGAEDMAPTHHAIADPTRANLVVLFRTITRLRNCSGSSRDHWRKPSATSSTCAVRRSAGCGSSQASRVGHHMRCARPDKTHQLSTSRAMTWLKTREQGRLRCNNTRALIRWRPASAIDSKLNGSSRSLPRSNQGCTTTQLTQLPHARRAPNDANMHRNTVPTRCPRRD